MPSLVSSDRQPRPELRAGINIRGSRWERALKRVIDLGGACLALVLFSPILMISAVLIKIEDRGPILYRRRVVGQQRGEFDAFKLRSMRVDADRVLEQNSALRAEYEQSFKLRSDPRVTRVGALLRKYSLDELPQLFNVLSGEMSLVGPRMITAPELQKYGEQEHLLRSVKPGLTGYWQVNGRQQTSYAERVAMDSYYIENWSLLLDLKILVLTPLKVLKGEGAY
jgi:lipopolysaccharide/colanic/teichoic acid biosynthesis glycosyltransferase